MRALRISRAGLACAVVLAVVTMSACGGSSGASGAGNGPGASTAGDGSSGGGGGGGHCSDPHPDNLALTFAAIVCVQKQTSVPQDDGSTELKLLVKITDKDPNAIHVTSSDFKVLDAVGHDVDAEPAATSGRAGGNDCIYQEITDDGFPLSPEKSFTVPGPFCFNLQQGEKASQLVWQGDVPVTLGRSS